MPFNVFHQGFPDKRSGLLDVRSVRKFRHAVSADQYKIICDKRVEPGILKRSTVEKRCGHQPLPPGSVAVVAHANSPERNEVGALFKNLLDLSAGQFQQDHRILERQHFEYVSPRDRSFQNVRPDSADVMYRDLSAGFFAKRIRDDVRQRGLFNE